MVSSWRHRPAPAGNMDAAAIFAEAPLVGLDRSSGYDPLPRIDSGAHPEATVVITVDPCKFNLPFPI